MDTNKDRALRAISETCGPDVQDEAVLALGILLHGHAVHPEDLTLSITEGSGAHVAVWLRARRPVARGIAFASPRLNRLGRPEAIRAGC
jgi:hypothetical protein